MLELACGASTLRLHFLRSSGFCLVPRQRLRTRALNPRCSKQAGVSFKMLHGLLTCLIYYFSTRPYIFSTGALAQSKPRSEIGPTSEIRIRTTEKAVGSFRAAALLRPPSTVNRRTTPKRATPERVRAALPSSSPQGNLLSVRRPRLERPAPSCAPAADVQQSTPAPDNSASLQKGS